VAVLEDIEISGGVIHPPSAAHQAFTDLYRRAALGRGVDPDIGPRLPAMLRAAGIADVQTCVVQPAGLQGEVKHVDYLTMDAIADAVVEAGLADRSLVDAITDELVRLANDPTTLMSSARIVQAWGTKPGP
jgi:hypothetical protein